MKNKKILAIGLCGAICLSIAGVTYVSALASDTPKVSTSETGNTSSADILYQDTDGGQISVDGKNWVAEADYEKNNAAPDVQWWTADEYEAWMNEQKKEMESLIGTGDGWYDGQGVFHEFTQESVDAMMDSYKETLENIKKFLPNLLLYKCLCLLYVLELRISSDSDRHKTPFHFCMSFPKKEV